MPVDWDAAKRASDAEAAQQLSMRPSLCSMLTSESIALAVGTWASIGASAVAYFAPPKLPAGAVHVAVHWHSPSCADGFGAAGGASGRTFEVLPLFLWAVFFGIAVSCCYTASGCSRDGIKWINFGTPEQKERVLALRDPWPCVAAIMRLMTRYMMFLLTAMQVCMIPLGLSGAQWNARCLADTAGCRAQLESAAAGGGGFVCCESCAGINSWLFWVSIALLIAVPLLPLVYVLKRVSSIIDEFSSGGRQEAFTS